MVEPTEVTVVEMVFVLLLSLSMTVDGGRLTEATARVSDGGAGGGRGDRCDGDNGGEDGLCTAAVAVCVGA